MARRQSIAWRDLSQPHWGWAAISLVVPGLLLLIAVLGLGRGSFVSSAVAVSSSTIAPLMSLGTLVVALSRRSRGPIAIATIGAVVITVMWQWFHWISNSAK